jgi:hypothetical protein
LQKPALVDSRRVTVAQVKRIRLAGQATVPSQIAGEGKPFGIGEGGLDRGQSNG